MSSAMVVAPCLDQDPDEIKYLGSWKPTSGKDVITGGNRVWSADSHAAALQMKRPFADVEQNEDIGFPTRRRRIEKQDSSKKVKVCNTFV